MTEDKVIRTSYAPDMTPTPPDVVARTMARLAAEEAMRNMTAAEYRAARERDRKNREAHKVREAGEL